MQDPTIVLADLKLTMYMRIALNLYRSTCLKLQTGIKAVVSTYKH